MASRKQMDADAASPHEARTLPRWSELPDFDLYMDQVLSLMERYVGPATSPDEKSLTASMVNNYVKTGLVPAPHKKRYSRLHLASLIVVCTLKSVLPLAAVQEILGSHREEDALELFYDEFCNQFEVAEREAHAGFNPSDAHFDLQRATIAAALNAQSQRAQALALYRLQASR